MFRIIFIIGLLIPFSGNSQTVTGQVVDKNNKPLENVTILWYAGLNGSITKSDGSFSIAQKTGSSILVASHSGYISDTIDISSLKKVVFILRDKKAMREVVVTSEKAGIILSNYSPIKTEILTSVELKKSACCDLAGCFETQSSVQPQTTNVITNAKELRILGLSGVYNQVLVDGFPMIHGLTSTYGISGIPGTLVDNIYIS